MRNSLFSKVLLAIISIATLVSCKPDEPSTITATPRQFSADAGSCTQNITVTSNTKWSASSNASWIGLSISAGNGDCSVPIVIGANNSSETRSAVITFTTNDQVAQATVTITQNGMFIPSLSVNQTEISVGYNNATVSANITSNTQWTISCNEKWCVPNATSGSGDKAVSFTIEKNSNSTQRTAEVKIRTVGENPKEVKITIKQSGASNMLSVAPENISTGASASTQYVELTSNTSWTLTCNETWCVPSVTSGDGNQKIAFAISENPYVSQRVAEVKIRTTGNTLPKEATITIKQSGADEYIAVTPDNISVSAAKEIQYVDLTTNTDWITDNKEGWIAIDTVNGKGSKKLKVTISKNNNRSSRTGVVTFKTTSGKSEAKLTIKQEASEAFLSISPEYVTVDPNVNSVYVDLNANVEWTASCNASWLTFSPASGSSSKQIHLKIYRNTTTSQRSTTIEFKSKDGKLKSTLNVTQTKGSNSAYLDVTPASINVGHMAYTAYIQISSSTSWTVSSSASWAKVSTSNGSGKQNIKVQISTNTSTAGRTAYVTIKSSNGSIQKKVKIEQLGYTNDHDIENVIPPQILDEMDNYIPIYSGTTPPSITGSYFVDPFTTVYCEDEGNGGYSPGTVVISKYIRFFNQNSSDNTISYKDRSESGSSYNEGSGYIMGSGDNFTIFLLTEGESKSVYNKEAVIISGTKSSSGIRNYYYGFVMLEVGPDPNDYIMDEGYYRIFKDQDGLAVNSSWSGNTNYVTTETKPSEVIQMLLDNSSIFSIRK